MYCMNAVLIELLIVCFLGEGDPTGVL